MAHRIDGGGRGLRGLRSIFKARDEHQARRAALPRARRGFRFEPLEPRVLLSVDLPTGADAIIQQGLQSLSQWAHDELGQLDELKQILPLFGNTLGSLADISDILNDNIYTPINTYLTGGGTLTSQGLADALEFFLGSNVTDLSDSSRLLFEVDFHFDHTDSVDLSLGANKFGLELADGSSVDATISLDFDFSFGVDLTAGLAPSEAFFIQVPEGGPAPILSVGLTVDVEDADNVSLDMKVGMLEATADLENLDVTATVDAAFMDPNGDGMLTRAEWEGTPISSVVALTTGPTSGLDNAAVDATINVAASLGTYSVSGEITVMDENLFDDSAPDVDFTAAQDLKDFSNLSPGDLVSFLHELGASLQGVASTLNPSGGIPLLSSGLDQLANFEDLMADLAGGLYNIELKDASSHQAPSELDMPGGALQHDAVLFLAIITIGDNGQPTMGPEVKITLTPGDVSGAAGATTLLKVVKALQDEIDVTALNGQVKADQDGTGKFLILRAMDTSKRLFVRYQGDDQGMRQLGFTPRLANAVFRFTSVQEFIEFLEDEIEEVIPAFNPDVDYNTSSELTFDLEWQADFSRSLPLDFTQAFEIPGGLGTLAITGHVTAQAGAKASVNARVGLDLSPLGSGFTADASDTLASLNGGAGVQNLAGENDLTFRLRDGTVFNVNLDSAVDLGDVIDLIEGQSGFLMDGVTRKVDVSFIADDPDTLTNEAVGLQLQDKTTGVGTFRIEAFEGSGGETSLAGLGLGILGSDVNGDGVIVGTGLHGDTLLKHAFIEDGASVSTELTVSATGIYLTASLGILEAGITNGRAGFKVTGGADLDSGNGRVSLADLVFGAGQASLLGDPGAADGVLASDATFSINVNGLGAVAVTVAASSTSGNTSLADLAFDLNEALKATSFTSPAYDGTPFAGKKLGDFLTATVGNGRISIGGSAVSQNVERVESLAISATNAQTNTKLGFQNGDSASSVVVNPTVAVMGTIDVADPDLAVRLPITVAGLEAFGIGVSVPEIVGDAAVATGVLTVDATFSISVDGITAVPVTVAASVTSGNTDLAGLVSNLNDALAATAFTSDYDGTPFEGKHLGDFITATVDGTSIKLTGNDVQSLSISATNAETNTKLGFQNGDADVAPDTRIDLTISANSPISLSPELAGLDASTFSSLLAPFSDFSLASLLKLADQILEFIKRDDLGLFSEPLPLVDRSVRDILSFLDDIEAAITTVKDAVAGFKNDALAKLDELQADGGPIDAAAAALTAAGEAELGERLLDAFEAIQQAVHALPDSLSDALEFPSSPQLASGLAALKATLRDITENTSVNVDDLKKEVALLRNTIPSAATVAKYLFNLVGLDDLAGFDLQTLFDQKVALQSALTGLNATEVTQALKDKFKGVLDDLTGSLVESFSDPDGSNPLSGSDISDWNPSAVLDVIGSLSSAIADLDTEIAGMADPDNDNEEAARDQIQAVLNALAAALPAALQVSFLESGGDKGVVFRFHYSKQLLDESLKLDFQIPDAGDFIPFGVKSGGEFNIDLGMMLNIGFGLDFTDLSDPASILFLTGDTSFEVTALVDAPLTAEVTIGGIKASITGTLKVQLDVDDGVNDDPAILKVTLGGTATDRVTLGAIAGSIDLSESAGELKAEVDAEVANLMVDNAIVVTADLPDFDQVEFDFNLDLSLAELDLTAIVQMIETFLGVIADGLSSKLMSELPLVGDIDFDSAATFIKDIRMTLADIRTQLEAIEADASDIEQQITDILNNALGSGGPAPGLIAGLGLITITEVTLDLADGETLISDPNAAVTVRFQIGADDAITAPFDAKLPALGLLSGDVGVDIALASTIDFGVRVSKTEGAVFLLNDDGEPEVHFGVTVNVIPEVVLDLFFLQLEITDNTLGEPELDVDVDIDLDYAGGDQVPLLDVSLSSFGFEPTFTTDVHLDLLLTASSDLIDNLPTLTTVFRLDWSFNIGNPTDPDGLTYVAFEDITLDLAGLLSGPIREIFEALDTFIDPLRPLLDFLNSEIPLISQVSQLVGLGPFTFLDGIRLLGEGGDTVATVVGILDSISGALMALDLDNPDPSIFTVNFGDYVLVDTSQPLFQANTLDDLSMELFQKGADLTSALGTNWDESAEYAGSYAKSDAGLFGTLGDEDGEGMLGITFPLLDDPKQIVNLIFGKPIDLVVWDVPRLEAKFEFSQLFGPIIPPFPVFARIAGSFSIFADFLVGLDTRGLQTGNFINGLFLGDRTPTTPDGEDVPELGLTMEFTAGAELNIPFARAGVEGGIGAGIFANFHDPNNDGKFYLDEVLDRASMGPECIFDLEGAIDVFLRAYLNIEIPLGFTSITIIDVDFTIIKVTLFDFSITCPPIPPPVPAHLSNGGSGATDPDTWNGDTTSLPDGTTLTKDATTFASGTLILHAGSFSDLRQPGASDIADDIKIRGEGEFDGEDGFGKSSYDGSTDAFDGSQVTASMGNGVVVEASESASGVSGDIIRDDLNNDGMNTADVILVEAYGVTHVYTGVQRIVIDAGNNDEEDSILIDATSVRVPVTVLGGGGDDEIQTGSANDVILAGAGEDAIAAGAGDDKVSGGNDNDEIFGNAGADTITGGDGDDTIYGGDNDHVDAGDGADDIQGNAGNDRIYGALGNDVLRGQEGTDQIHGGVGADELHGGPEDDQLFGDEEADFATPTDGVGQGDFMIGGPGNDQLSGGAGNDRMIGGGIVGSSDGGDLMEGGEGNDVMIGDVGDLAGGITLTGGSGNDTMIGGSGDDQMYGQGGTDEMYGDGSVDSETHSILPDEGSGADYMEGNAGDDTMFGGQLADRMIGGSSSLPASGLDAADVMYGGDGPDIMLGDNGSITGGFGNVATNAMGGSGADTMFGGLADDVLFGGGLGDRLSGSTGNDVIVGDQGTRSATSITADHSAEANSSGADIISGSDGMDTLLGGEGNDEIAGDAQADIAIGDDGIVTLSGGVVRQVETKEFAFGGNDTITGSGAPDILLGGSGADLITGGGDVSDDIMLGDNGVVRDNNAGLSDNNDIFSNDPAGAVDTMDGGPGHDIMLGGAAGDILVGGSGDDLILGDHGNVERNASEAVRFIETVFGSFKGKNFSGAGGIDTISGKAGTDLALGGQAGDTIYGDGATPGAGDDRDILMGDNGEITLVDPLGPGAGAGPDAIITFNGAVAEMHTTDLTAAEGGIDTISGNAADDILAGGVVGDTLHGNEGDDIALGDNAGLDWLYAGGDPDFVHLEAGFTFDATFTTLDLIATQLPAAHPGGRDTIFGDAGDDILMGGEDADTVWGDDGDESGVASANDDIIFGDHGIVYPHNSALSDFPSRNFFSIDTGDDDAGEGDRLFGEEGNDLLLGEQGDDRIFGGDDDDDLIGGHNVAGGIDELSAPAVEATLNPDKNDIMDGGSGDDALAGDNAEIWRKADSTSPRFRALTGQTLYDPLAGPTGQAQVTAAQQLDPRGSVGRTTLLLDHTAALQALAGARPWGADVMAGNSEHDLLFGQLGDELMQGDGSIDAADDGLPGPTHQLTITDSGLPSTADTLYFNVTEADTDGDDYLEGNGGGDLAYGNLGQDDIIGGSSALFGLTTPNQRPDGVDIIFGGAGTPDRIARNAETADDDLLVPQTDRHAVDSDTILGDNGAIYRIVGTNGVGGGAFLTFNYDAMDPERGGLHVIPRAVDLLDYVRGVGDSGVNGVAHGAGDTIHGESGDDVIHGMIGTDLLYGDSEDDDVLGESGHDWVTGGTGEDGILGDDGFLFTSRNGDPGEPLHGVAALPASQLNRFIKTPGGIQQAILNVSGQLKKSVNLEPFLLGGDDILYGGLGDDVIHGGAGSDAISGAEALALSAAQVGGARMTFAYASPTNPGGVLGFEAHAPFEFALYDEFEPLRRIELDANGQLVKNGAQPGPYVEFLLNFEAFTNAGDQTGTQIHDGNDILFGDGGADWIVGGTDQDHAYGGFGDDLMNLDDNLATNGGLNDFPDVPEFTGTSTIPGQIGADTAYGGGGRDVLLANSGADRLIDWVGEFNSFVVPFAPFGEFTVSRSLLPQLPNYLYDLSKSDGADQTRAFDTGTDPLRNGEPNGEMGLVLQQDPTWQAQTGAPDDPQAGNKPGGKKDTMEAADFGSGTGVMAVESGSWSVVSGKYQSAGGGEALSIINVHDQIPPSVFLEATLNLAKPAAGKPANGYLIFDYRTSTDFKFAGLSASDGRMVIGQRDAKGWTVLNYAIASIKTNRDYSVRLSLDDKLATLMVDGIGQLKWTFADALNDGLLALGANKSVARFDDVKVWRNRSPLDFVVTEDLSDNIAQHYVSEAGSWLVQAGLYAATPEAGLALSTLALDLAPTAQLEYEAIVSADSFAGLVFDYISPTQFKYVALLPDADQIVMGHRSSSGWFTDTVASKPILAGHGYSLKVALDGTVASASLDGRESLGWTYNALVNDGKVGLLSRGGSALFDNLTARSDDPGLLETVTATQPRQQPPTGQSSTDGANATLQMLSGADPSWLIDARRPTGSGQGNDAVSLAGTYEGRLRFVWADKGNVSRSNEANLLDQRDEDSPWAGIEGDWLVDL